MTRTEVAKLLGCSTPTVRRMEGSDLTPTVGTDGVHRFDPLEVIQVMNSRLTRAVDPSKEGERDARVFEMLDAGRGLREIVTTLRLPVDVVLRLSKEWKEACRRDLIVPPACRVQLEQLLGRVTDAAELVQLVGALDADRDRVEFEKTAISNSMTNVIVVVAEIAARSTALANRLPELRKELDAEQGELLDRAFKHHSGESFGETIREG